jgi:hypothetical protein
VDARRGEISNRIVESLGDLAVSYVIRLPDDVTLSSHAFLVRAERLAGFDEAVQRIRADLGEHYAIEPEPPRQARRPAKIGAAQPGRAFPRQDPRTGSQPGNRSKPRTRTSPQRATGWCGGMSQTGPSLSDPGRALRDNPAVARLGQEARSYALVRATHLVDNLAERLNEGGDNGGLKAAFTGVRGLAEGKSPMRGRHQRGDDRPEGEGEVRPSRRRPWRWEAEGDPHLRGHRHRAARRSGLQPAPRAPAGGVVTFHPLADDLTRVLLDQERRHPAAGGDTRGGRDRTTAITPTTSGGAPTPTRRPISSL